uniref:Uncharacterized protein n=1 Tax=Anguilla anguilla TaxID=7936 RepID=A0A0E9PQE8_ANGAN
MSARSAVFPKSGERICSLD